MTLNELTASLPILTGGILAIGLILFILALRLFRRGRKASLWQNRRQAGKRGFRVMLTAIGFIGLSGMLCIATLIFSSLEEDEPTEQTAVAAAATTASSPTTTSTATLAPTSTPTPSPTTEPEISPSPTPTSTSDTQAEGSMAANTMAPTPTASITATATPTITASSSPSITMTATGTNTPSPSVTSTPSMTPSPTSTITTTATPSITPFPTLPINIAPPSARATPHRNMNLEISAISDTLTDAYQPLNPREVFDTGVSRLYFFITFSDMKTGLLWRPALFKDGSYLDGGIYLWGLQSEGTTYFFFGRANGFAAGDYEIRIYVGDAAEPFTTQGFTIQ